MATITATQGQPLQEILEDVQVGTKLDYATCKEIYLSHPMGAKIVDTPIEKALMTNRKILVQDAPDMVIEQFNKTWKQLKCDKAIEAVVRNSRIYGTGSIAAVFKDTDIDPSKPADWQLCQSKLFTFNVLDPLNTAGSGIFTQSPNDYDFQEIGEIRVQGKSYHHTRAFQVVNESQIYLSWTPSAFGYTGRSAYARAIYPLKSFISAMIANDLVAQKAGVLVAKTKKSGSFIDRAMQKIGELKRYWLKTATTGNVIEIGIEDSIETLNMQNVDSALSSARTHIIEDIASACKMPSKLLLSETLATGFGEGSEDAKQIAAYLESFRLKHAPLYDWIDAIVRKAAWTPEFYKLVQERHPVLYSDKPYDVAIKEWVDCFDYQWENLVKESESEAVKVEETKFKAITDLMGVVFDKLDPANQARFLRFAEDNINEAKRLFPNPLELDYDAYEQHQQEAQQQEQMQVEQQGAMQGGQDEQIAA